MNAGCGERPRHTQRRGVSAARQRVRIWGRWPQVTCSARRACLQGTLHQHKCRSDCRSSRRSYTRRNQHHSSRSKRSQGRRSLRHSCHRSLRHRFVRRCGQKKPPSWQGVIRRAISGWKRAAQGGYERTRGRGTYQWSQLHPELRRRRTRAPFVVSDSPTNVQPLTEGSSRAR